MKRPALLSIALCIALAAVVALAPAAGAKRWTRFASGGMNVSDQVGLARTADGVLHVAFRRRGSTQDLLVAPIGSGGRVGSPAAVVSGWAGIGSPALVGRGRTLAAFFPGTQTLTTGDPTYGLDLASSSDAGASWSVSPTAIARNDFAFARTPAAVLTLNGSFLQSWYGADSTVVHPGLDPNVPNVSGYGVGTDQALATASDGEVMAAWCTELQEPTGVSVAEVNPATGARIGAVRHLSDTGRCPADTRVAFASFRDVPRDRDTGLPYFYAAASSANGRKVLLNVVYRGGQTNPRTLASGKSIKQQIAIATAPHGRVWVAWKDSESGDLVFRRSDPGAGLDYGAEVVKHLPAGQSISQLALDAQDDRVDAVATTSDDNNNVSLFSTQVLPGLTLEGGSRTKIKRTGFRVLDVDRGVKGATVKVAGHTLTTTSSGYAKITLAPGTYNVRASHPGYVGATLRVKLH